MTKTHTPVRNELIIPTDKPVKIGWKTFEVLTDIPVKVLEYLFEWMGWDIYYNNKDRIYYLIGMGSKVPAGKIEEAQKLADYVFELDGTVIKDRGGVSGTDVFSLLKDIIDTHQIMIS